MYENPFRNASGLKFSVRRKLLQLTGDSGKEGGSQAAIDDAVIVGEGEVHHVTDDDGVSFRGLEDDGPFLDSAYGEDSDLRLVDDGSAHQAAESTYVGQGEGTVLGVVGPQFIEPRVVSQSVDLPGEACKVELVGMADHGNDEVAAGQCRSHPDIDIFFDNDLVTVEGAVDQRVFLYTTDHCFDEQRGKGELGVFSFFEF